ncbi:SusC/RagA family TonB-linked outer membrane protein [Planktosalinus lacus]|uniref:SusC/RagA family TonB-linked outer membrane protein n=1 Tax=Planktosalinus lacus TaxID=1526573 RepID=A0A8J2V8R8_9FLAO|nr:SusC/RagA family TonB-linked outer membrane protein [Planktosalinus lacus]GGD88079.1 SusC/RagA family TonB-linked outer membrane protein [Planktosalinus lacus]
MTTKFSGILTLLLAFIVQISFAQEKTISGTVTDDIDLPLPGVNIIVKGTNSGTQSDFDGNYSISAEVGQTLVFSYLGFTTQEVAITPSTNTVNLQLQPDAAELDAVVVTGYTRRNQTVQTSAVVAISAEEINQLTPTTSIDNLLQGKAAGVQVTAANGKPGQGAFVRIRGMGSLVAGASSPLYIVDGAPIREQDLASIANEDIENITILKDAAVTAQYGSRGANGVVVITTKSGNRNTEAKVRFSSRYGVISKTKDNFSMMDAEQKMQYEAELFALGVVAAGSRPGVTTAPGSPERQFLLDNANDWQDVLLKDGIVQSNNVSFSGGAEKVDYFFSVGHDRNTGIIDNINGFERLNTRLNLNFDAKEWLSVSANVGYSRSLSDEPRDRNNVQNPFRAMYIYNAYEPEFQLDENGNPELDANGDPIYNPTHQGFSIRGALLSEPENTITNVTLASVNTTVKFTDNFTYTFGTAINHVNYRRESYSKPGGILQNLIGDPDFPGLKTDNGAQRLDMTLSNRLNYSLNSESGHNLNVLGLFEYNFNENNFYRVTSRGFPSALLTTQINAAEVTIGSTNRNRLTLLSYGLFADYNFREKYLASASIRTDGSSNFGKGKEFGTFYSASVGWNIAKEDFFAVDAVNDFKIRASYGTVGNRNGIGRYAPQDLVAFGAYPGGSATIPANVGNPELQWETTETSNIGVELNMFNNRLRTVVDYFKRNTTDLLFTIPTADESGVGGIGGNLGEIENTGFEVSLQGDIIRKPSFTWTMGGNAGFMDNKIIELPDGEDIIPNAFNILYREGEALNQHYLLQYAGVDPNTGAPLYFGEDGGTYRFDDLPESESDNRVLTGKSSIPEVEGGFFTNFSYKGIGLRADFIFKAGNYINNFNRAAIETDGVSPNGNHHVGAFNYWQQPGDTNVLPSPIYRTEVQASDRFLEKGDFIRMRNIVLSYNFPSALLERSPLNSLRVYVQGQNLLTFTEFFGDPEVGISSGETIDFVNTVAPGEATLFSYPQTKSFQVGIDVSF